MPKSYSLYHEADQSPDRWWMAFGSGELNALVAEALSQNFDIKSAWANLKKADAVAAKAGANRMPWISADAGAGKDWIQHKTTSGSGTSTREENLFTAGAAASFEVDLWGRLHALRQVEALNVHAAREDIRTIAISISAAVVETWIDILTVRQKITILNKQIKINTTLLNLQMLRFSNGKASALDVSQQKEVLAAAKAERPLLELAEKQLLNSLALLLGRVTTKDLKMTETTLPQLIPIPESGLPADLISSRPDIRSAGLKLRASDWQVSAARADRLPAMTLSARSAFSSGSLDILFNNWINTLAASITGPVFDGGYRKAEVDRTRAEAEIRLAVYAKTVAQAIKEVEDSLVGERQQAIYIGLLEDQQKAARLSLKDARIQYQNGQSDYLSYLVAWTSVQNLELKLVSENAALIKNRVSMYRSLGGGWTHDMIPITLGLHGKGQG